MKFLVLALCVCAASAGTFPAKPWQQAGARAAAVVRPVAEVVASPFVAAAVVAKSVVSHGQDAEAPILRSESDVHADGFNYVYETGNGISAEASGALKKVDNTEAVAFQGSYKYTAPDGTPVQVTYIADENGYQPQGDVLPVGPAIPPAILRSLEYNAAHPQQAEPSSAVKKF